MLFILQASILSEQTFFFGGGGGGGENPQPTTGYDIEQQLSASGCGCTSVIIVGNTGHEGVREVWETIGPMGMENTGTEGVWEV